MKVKRRILPVESIARELDLWLKADRRQARGKLDFRVGTPGGESKEQPGSATNSDTTLVEKPANVEASDDCSPEDRVAERRTTGQRSSVLTERRVHRRVGLLTSIDGEQIIILLLDPLTETVELWQSDLVDNSYTSLTSSHPQLHWSERVLWNLFGIVPRRHPRLKPIVIHEGYPGNLYPLRKNALDETDLEVEHDSSQFLKVDGEGVWELPVGPIHAGVIEPAHFRFSCLGETIVNLELKFGYVHRGVEKRITEVPWHNARFIAEAAASDTACANALAHAITIESLFGFEVPPLAQVLRTIALETERIAMHIADVGGMMTDIGMVGLAANMSKLRGTALNLAQTLSGSRFLRAYILPGGVSSRPSKTDIIGIKRLVSDLRDNLKPLLTIFQDNQAAIGRMEGIGKIKQSLAQDFGFVGVAGRACGLAYDARRHFSHGLYPQQAPDIALETGGDVLARTNVRIKELWASLDLIEKLAIELLEYAEAKHFCPLPAKLPANEQSVGIVEAFRGELIHLCITDDDGSIVRYAIKDPSLNNWTMISIVVRDNLIADFPLCNKSLALSYSGTDL
ncbi:MAG: NADH-quinone oxidoreductase subunit C [Cyanobacteria bacterium]|nr:NADH-quinone oxidoreductase subunit C [Cyanobacteriota bacterium]